MLQTMKFMLLVAGVLFFTATPLLAAVDATPLRTLYSKAEPVDTAISGDGKVFFILTDKESVEIYDGNGTLKGVVAIEGNADKIRSSASGDKIYVTEASTRETKVIAVEFVQKIETSGSPFRGPVDAPVVVAIYSDFQ